MQSNSDSADESRGFSLRRSLKRRLQALRPLRARKAPTGERPSDWAERIAIDGVDNLHRVNALLYRSAQPSELGMSKLRTLGIRSVINLRAFHCDLSGIAGTGLLSQRLHVLTWKIQDRHVIRVLRLLRDARNAPFLIHCKHGADRTGLMTAMFRIIEQGWSKEAAIREMVEGGYGYHRIWRNIVRYIEHVDVERIRAAVIRHRLPRRTRSPETGAD
jgi:protein tyrosine/serine phosphatase